MDIEQVATEFVNYYYNTFDTNRQALGSLYRETSLLTFERNKYAGVAQISEKLTTLPFQKVRHNVTALDVQPFMQTGAIVIKVSGALLVDEETNPIQFSQAFILIPEGGSFYVQNDIFSLNIS
ncbi:Nuclear transport factor 2 [Entomophthora muscae]|uniref:Nuclear transport factor 2 n=2 Tax=Entomophthora muscae TaxID=34485 RepID=A0ACC2RY66_9FUNG|nr:Nuclear transport factor 2 [Entomophthora muscae]KAJ9073331.1 Nuclear transport factor 2 [Entomophthora muscae]